MEEKACSTPSIEFLDCWLQSAAKNRINAFGNLNNEVIYAEPVESGIQSEIDNDGSVGDYEDNICNQFCVFPELSMSSSLFSSSPVLELLAAEHPKKKIKNQKFPSKMPKRMRTSQYLSSSDDENSFPTEKPAKIYGFLPSKMSPFQCVSFIPQQKVRENRFNIQTDDDPQLSPSVSNNILPSPMKGQQISCFVSNPTLEVIKNVVKQVDLPMFVQSRPSITISDESNISNNNKKIKLKNTLTFSDIGNLLPSSTDNTVLVKQQQGVKSNDAVVQLHFGIDENCTYSINIQPEGSECARSNSNEVVEGDIIKIEPFINLSKPISVNNESTLEDLQETESGKILKKIKEGSARRGRPSAEQLTTLTEEGLTSEGPYKCSTCSRVFTREQSLEGHMRIHTGERPFMCDYPGCCKAFRQSGQLRTHQRIHTGEKPFSCSIADCNKRFTHSNRHCSQHPLAPLSKVDDVLEDIKIPDRCKNQPQITDWFKRYISYKVNDEMLMNNVKNSVESDIDDYPDTDTSKIITVKSYEKKNISKLKKLPTRKDEDNEKMLGALALIELAKETHSFH